MARIGPRFFIVNVFAERKFSGNQLAVVEMERTMTSRRMQEIAAEFNFPETAFVRQPAKPNADWRVRIFTPKQEIPFAGHPTLGAAYVIRRHLQNSTGKKSGVPKKNPHVADRKKNPGNDARGWSDPDYFHLELQAGRIPVWFEEKSDLIWMRQNKPTFGPVHPPESIAEILCTSERNLRTGFLTKEAKLQEVSTGIPFLMAPMKNLESVRNAYLDMAAYNRYFQSRPTLPIYIFTAEALSRKNQFHARMFAPHFGIPEDPATGSATGCLGAYLARYGITKGKGSVFAPGADPFALGTDPILDLRIEQGFSVNRPSLLRLQVKAPAENSEPDDLGDILVGGRVVDIASGVLA